MSSKELYIGNLDPDTKSQDIRDIFQPYGVLNRCEVKFGMSAYSVAFGFVAFDSSKDAERAQRKEHGRSHRGRRLIVEFSKTTPGQNGGRSRYIGGDEYMSYGNKNRKSRSRSGNRDELKSHNRRGSPPYSRKSFKDQHSSNDHRRKRNHSSMSKDRKLSLTHHRLYSNDNKLCSSHSRKNEQWNNH